MPRLWHGFKLHQEYPLWHPNTWTCRPGGQHPIYLPSKCNYWGCSGCYFGCSLTATACQEDYMALGHKPVTPQSRAVTVSGCHICLTGVKWCLGLHVWRWPDPSDNAHTRCKQQDKDPWLHHLRFCDRSPPVHQTVQEPRGLRSTSKDLWEFPHYEQSPPSEHSHVASDADKLF